MRRSSRVEELSAVSRLLQVAGRRQVRRRAAEIVRQSMALGQRWGAQIGREIEEEARQELKKRGIEL